jgi:hypothetical protein
MTWTGWLLAAMLVCDASPAVAQDYQSDFPPDEFRARWARVLERIGDNAVVVVQSMPRTDGFMYPRQYNTFLREES